MTFNRKIYLITGIYFLFLFVILLIFGYTKMNDTEGYVEYAQVCLKVGQPYPCYALMYGQPFIWNIGSINLIAASLALFGTFYPVLILMCILKALTAMLIAKITKLLFNEKTAVTAIILYCLYPNNWGQSTTLASEIPMIFLTLTSLYLCLKTKKTGWLITAGIVMCIANWFRPIAILFIISIIVYFALFDREKWMRRGAYLIAGYAVTAIIIGTECYARTGHFVYQCESFWYNMADDAYDGATVDPHFGKPLFQKGTPRYIENREHKTCFECSEIWKERCTKWLLHHKAEYLGKVPGRLFYMYNNDIDNIVAFLPDKSKAENNNIILPIRHIVSEFGNLTAIQKLALVCTLCYFFILLSSVCGTFALLKDRKWKSAFLPAFIIVFGTLSLVLLVQGETRFKAPFMPFFFMLSASLLTRIKRKRDS